MSIRDQVKSGTKYSQGLTTVRDQVQSGTGYSQVWVKKGGLSTQMVVFGIREGLWFPS